jgi:hypothetical protein
LIADEWFKYLEKIEDKGFLPALKREMNNKTIIGEYVGNQDFQHLVSYKKQTIIMYSMIDNLSPEICMMPEETYKFFKKFDLDKVSVERVGVFTDYDQMCDSVADFFKKISKSAISEEEEGSVLYFIKRTEDAVDEKVLSLCKLKTLEYRIFRKLREKMRNYVKAYEEGKFANDQKKYDDFKKETKELVRGHDLPRPVEFYF